MGTIDRCDYTREQIVAKVKAKESLRGLDLRNLVLTNLDLRYVDFTKAYMYGVDFNHSDLRGANFTDAYLYHANFTKADLRGAVISEEQKSSCICYTAIFNDAESGETPDLRDVLIAELQAESDERLKQIADLKGTA